MLILNKSIISNKKFVQDMVCLLNEGKQIKVIHATRLKLQELKKEEEDSYKYKAVLLNLIIDASSESREKNNDEIIEELKNVLEIYESNKEAFLKVIHPATYYYNVANAYSTLYDKTRFFKGFKYSPDSIKLNNIPAKNCYWKSYKLMDESVDLVFKHQVLKNLGSCLSGSGRVVEALQYYDLILKENKEHPFANGGRGCDLNFLKEMSGVASSEMLMQIYNNWNAAAENFDIKHFADYYSNKRNSIKKMLLEKGFDSENHEKDRQDTQKEAELHSEYWKFCLNNFLTLNEHAVYCKCAGASKDNLMITTSAFPIMGEQIPKMEMLLNHVKAQYHIARRMYYDGMLNKFYDKETSYANLGDNSILETNSELFKASFRLCFSVLDKIAHGICEFYDLAAPAENIYFHNFWKSNSVRWDKINSIENNFSLIALFSQATDLNSNYGEWAELKSWRDAIEHNLLVLIEDGKQGNNLLGVYKWKRSCVTVEYSDFIEKNLLFLRFVRASIFYFVFCIRSEGAKAIKEHEKIGLRGVPFEIQKRK